MSENILNPAAPQTANPVKDLALVLQEVEKKVKENRKKYNDSDKSIKDLRRIFDQDSSQMNQAIFNDAPQDETHRETLRTICILVEILSRTGK